MASRLAKFTGLSLGALAVALAVLVLILWRHPPDLLRVGANYSAKIVCSNVFLAGRDPGEVLRTDVQAPGVALLKLMRVSVDREHGVVQAGLLGFIGDGLAIVRPTHGCSVISDARRHAALPVGQPPALPAAAPRTDGSASTGDALWPDGSAVAADTALDRVLADDALAGPGMRAVLVVSGGRIVAERYGAGFTAATPLLGWSMTKSVVAGMVGALIQQGRLSLGQAAGWTGRTDGRERIRIADLMSMSSGLRFNEAYGAVSDVTRMLYLEPDMAGFAAGQPLAHPVGTVWSYSSGTANILSRIVQDAAGPLGADYPDETLFKPLGMPSAVMETDERGTLVGSSYMYATARDWARYGQFLLQNGVWHGTAILPPGFVDTMAAPAPASGGEYGQGLVWLWAADPVKPGQNPDLIYGLPPDTFWMEGHDGQSIAVIRSRGVVIVRLGLTPASNRYQPERLVKAVLDALH